MGKNNIEQYGIENNTAEPTEIIDEGQDFSIEHDLEELNADFEVIEKNYEDIVANPESTQAEKTQASIWMSRGKSLLYKSLAMLSLSMPLKTGAQTDFSSEFKNRAELSLDEELEKYREFGSFMAYNLASEKPTAYQAEQIQKLENGIIAELNGKKFASMTELVSYINQAISSDFSNQENTIYIKDAFPEEPGAEAKGSFDCDTRLLISLSILNKVGITSDQLEFCMLKGHALLEIKEDNVFFEMTTNSPRELSKKESLELNKINSFDKYKAYLLGKEATALALEGAGNIFRGERGDSEKIDLALNKMIVAAELDPNNLTNNLNLLTLLKQMNYREFNDRSILNKLVSTVSENIKRGLLNNYYEINTDGENNKTLVLQAQEINNQTIEPRRLEDLGSVEQLTSKALSESDYLSEKFNDLGRKLFYDLQHPKAALPIFEALANKDKNNKDTEKLLDYSLCKQMIARCYFDLQQYDKYLSLAENELYSLLLKSSRVKNVMGEYFRRQVDEENLKISAAYVLTGKIVINEETVEDFCNSYKHDPLFSSFISGKQQWHASAIEAVEALRAWPGFEDMIITLDNWRAKQEGQIDLH